MVLIARISSLAPDCSHNSGGFPGKRYRWGIMAKESKVSFYSEADLAQIPTHLPGLHAVAHLRLKPMWLEWKVSREERQSEVQEKSRRCITDELALILSQMKGEVTGWFIICILFN